jgi:hypothetical protein
MMTPMAKNLRIWVDGELLVDEPSNEDQINSGNEGQINSGNEGQINPGGLAGRHRGIITLAAKRLQPWRMELGDRDADVNDAYWLS